MDYNKALTIVRDEDFVKKVVLMEMYNDIVQDPDFIEKCSYIEAFYETADDMEEIEDIEAEMSSTIIDILEKDFDFLKLAMKDYHFQDQVYIMMCDFIEKNGLYKDTELFYIMLERGFNFSEEVFKYYLNLDEENLIKNFTYFDSFPSFLNNSEYLKKFVEYGNYEVFYNASFFKVALDVPFDLFKQLIDKNIDAKYINNLIDTEEKFLLASKNYNVQFLSMYIENCKNKNIKAKMNLEMAQYICVNKRTYNRFISFYGLDFDFDVAHYLVKRDKEEIISIYIDLYPDRKEEIKSLIKTTILNNKKNINTIIFNYIKNDKELLNFFILNYTGDIIPHLERYIGHLNQKEAPIEEYLEVLKELLKSPRNCFYLLSWIDWPNHPKIYELAFEYGYKDIFRDIHKKLKPEEFNTSLILKYGVCGIPDDQINLVREHDYEYYQDEQFSSIKDKIKELRKVIIKSVYDNEPLSDELKDINEDPNIIYLMAGFSIKDNMLSNYEYIKAYYMYKNHIKENRTLNLFAEACENGLVNGRVVDEELVLTALNRGYTITEDTPKIIANNPNYMLEAIKRDKDSIKFYEGDLTFEMCKLLFDYVNDERIYMNRDFVKYIIELGHVNIIEEYAKYFDEDDELIRLAISNGYNLYKTNIPQIMNNYEYIKLFLLSYKASEIIPLNNYNEIISDYAEQGIIDEELIDAIYPIIGATIPFINPKVISTYENCEYMIRKGSIGTLNQYIVSLGNSDLKDSKLPDLNLFLMQLLNNKNIYISYSDLNKYLSNEEQEILITYNYLVNILKKHSIINYDNIGDYFSSNGISNKLYDMFRENDYALFKELHRQLLHDDNLINNGIPIGLFNFYKVCMKEYLNINEDIINKIVNDIPNGKNVILYLNNPSIIKLMNCNTVKFDKIINLFKIPSFSYEEFNDKIYDALKQEQFTRDYPMFKNIFAYYRECVRVNNVEELERLKYLINTILPDTSYEEIDVIVNEARNSDLDKLHSLCSRFTKRVREIYRAENNNLIEEVDLPFRYRRDDLIKKVGIHYVLIEKSFNTLKKVGLDMDEDLFNILRRIMLKDSSVTKEEKQKYGRYINKLAKFLYEYSEENISFNEKEWVLYLKDKIEKSYYIKDSQINILSTISKMDFDFIESLINDEKLYNKYIELNNKYKIGNIPFSIVPLISKVLNKKIEFNFQNLDKYIMYFSGFIASEIKKQNADSKTVVDIDNIDIKFMTLLKYFVSVNSEIKEISRILTTEEYGLIEKDQGPNSSNTNSEARLSRAISLVSKLYNNGKITIPSFDKNISYKNKEINVVVGNRTNLCNLTHGERTGACMRMFGAGETLFNFCLDNPNGFHIMFLEPNTHEYISRVSGFRNGNTVFLNQLRYSCNKKLYTNSDLVEYIKLVAQELIDLTRDSECPIANVVISDDYAMENCSLPLAKMDVYNIKEGFPFFYSDIEAYNGYILSTISDSNYINVDTDKSNVPTYKPTRGKIYGKEVGMDKLVELINNRYSIKKLLNGVDYTTIGDLVDNVIDGYVGSDFYVYIDEDYEIYYDYFDMDVYHDKETSLAEMNKYKEIIMNKYNISEKRY